MTAPLYLVGNREIRMLLGNISRQRVYQLTTRADFPAPVANLSQGKVWSGTDVESWMERKRRPRQPAPFTPPDPAFPSPAAPARPPSADQSFPSPTDPAYPSLTGPGFPSPTTPALPSPTLPSPTVPAFPSPAPGPDSEDVYSYEHCRPARPQIPPALRQPAGRVSAPARGASLSTGRPYEKSAAIPCCLHALGEQAERPAS
ncbi:hypothetical protein [Actinoplanes sp. G11-F43]|uniref:helix-turn-helix transcriptional regulator n=1 Tax=Actinoplanes sp. G11-F43 TaxID=3424130 RepID=UPI003D3311C1